MSDQQKRRYVYEQLGTDGIVTDSYSGEIVYKGPYQTAKQVVDQRNAGNALLYEAMRSVMRGLVQKHAAPWSIQPARPGGWKIVAVDGMDELDITAVDDIETAGQIIRLADEIELELFPDGRR
jgi:hypothetical protein